MKDIFSRTGLNQELENELAQEETFEFPVDRVINATDTNEYSSNLRDENMWEEEIIDTEVPTDDSLPRMARESGEGERPIYSETGYKYDD